MMKIQNTSKLIMLLVVGIVLAGCGDVFNPTQPPAPILVTLPVVTPSTPTPESDQTITPTSLPLTPTVMPTPPPTPIPQAEGIGATGFLWEWNEVAPPSALAATGSRLAVIIADGRFAWMDASSGRIEGQDYLWSGLLEGDSWGEVYTDGSVAVVAVRETNINASTGLAESRSKLVVFGAEANMLWSLPELDEPQHFYSAMLASGPGLVVVGKWPYSFDDNSLAVYELFSGDKLWETSEGLTGYQQIEHDDTSLYVLHNNLEGGAVASHDLRSGEERWRWSDETVIQPDKITLRGGNLYILTAETLVALDAENGDELWRFRFNSAPEAGLGVGEGTVFLAPAPTVDLGFRPGLVSIRQGTGDLVWHSLIGLLANPLAVGDNVLWTIVTDYDNGEVWLSGLEPVSGLEEVRLRIGQDTSQIYRLVALGTRVYVLADSLRAYGY